MYVGWAKKNFACPLHCLKFLPRLIAVPPKPEEIENTMNISNQKAENWNANDYANNSSAQFEWAKQLIGKLHLNGNEHLLDIGCGDGKITYQLAMLLKTGTTVGIDASASMIKLAKQNYPKAQYPNLSFLQMSATAISLAQQFDMAFSNAALHWINNHVSVLNGVYNHLNKNGKILFQMGGRGNASDIVSVITEVMNLPKWQNYFQDFSFPYSFYGIEEYETWLPENGFKPIRIELIPKDMQHQGKTGLKGWLRTTWFPYTDQLPEEYRDEFLSEVVEIYTNQYPIDSKGRTHVKMVRLEVEAHI